MPAAKPRRKINRTRAKANENSLPSHNRILVIRFRMVAGRRSLFDRSAAGRLLDNSDIVIGIPPRCRWPLIRSTQRQSRGGLRVAALVLFQKVYDCGFDLR